MIILATSSRQHRVFQACSDHPGYEKARRGGSIRKRHRILPPLRATTGMSWLICLRQQRGGPESTLAGQDGHTATGCLPRPPGKAWGGQNSPGRLGYGFLKAQRELGLGYGFLKALAEVG